MPYCRIIGDTHGHKNELYLVLRSMPEDVTSAIQLGDMGVGFGQGDYWHDTLDSIMNSYNARFIRGNHDNPAICKTMPSYIPDGFVANDCMFVGGAWSIDNPNAALGWYRRTEGVDWWEDEECSINQINQIIDIYATIRPRVMFSHDCPTSVAKQLFFDSKKLKGMQYATRTASALQSMYEIHQPDYWFFGHWHFTVSQQIGATHFMCLGELDYVDFDLTSLTFK